MSHPYRSAFAALGVLVVALVAGCSSSTSDLLSAAPASARPTPTASPTPDPEAVIRQYASLIAGPVHSYHDAYQSYEQQECFADTSDLGCEFATDTVSLSADTIVITLQGANSPNPGNKDYIGPPPPEIATLVAETLSQAQAVYNDDPMPTSTPTPRMSVDAAELDETLHGWDPYLGG